MQKHTSVIDGDSLLLNESEGENENNKFQSEQKELILQDKNN